MERLQLKIVEAEVPTLLVEMGEDKGYLKPFRGCCFQVCGNVEGEVDMGSSAVMDLKDFLKFDEDTLIETYLMFIFVALSRWHPNVSKEYLRTGQLRAWLEIDVIPWLKGKTEKEGEEFYRIHYEEIK